MIYCLENENTSEVVRYTLEFVLNSLGYFYNWIANPISDNQDKIHISYGESSEIRSAAHTIILPKIYPLKTLHEQKLDWNEISIDGIKIPVLGLFKTKSRPNSAINFDLIASTYFHLVRMDELKYTHPDEIDATINQALLYKYNKYQTPVVDIIINWFGKNIENIHINNDRPIIKKAAFPNGEKFGVALTHDIDLTRAINPIKKRFLSFINRLQLPSWVKYERILELDRKIWALDDLLDDYKRMNLQATFNFIPRLNEGRSYRYNINSRKFKKLFKRLKIEGHEIGFHPSRYAFNHPGRYKRELKKLKRISKEQIYGLRQHYLRCLYPQIWRVVNSLNLNYDSSLAYRRMPGFRAGTTRTFSCFDHINQMKLNCLEFSTPFFEESLPNMGRDPEKARETISSIIESVNINHGILTVLWHPNNMYQSDQFQEIWEWLISKLGGEEVYLKPLSGHFKWQLQRQQITMTDIQIDHERINFAVNIPKNIDRFALHIPEVHGPIQTKKADYKIDVEKGILLIQPERDAQTIEIQIETVEKI
jgi:hypothetical protein